jgi:TetR/AcrR family transcriptional regulator, cholesterol catabolism regulator
LPTRNKKPRILNRRELIIKTASRLFREKGYERTTVRDLADAVGMQSGSLFFHFRSKEEILLAVLENGLRRAIEILARGLAAADTPNQKASAIFHGHLKAILEEERDTFTVILRDWHTLSATSRRRVIILRDQYEAHIDRALKEIAESGLIPRETRLLRFFILGALNWTVQWYRADGDWTVDQLAEGFLSIALRKDDSAPR